MYDILELQKMDIPRLEEILDEMNVNYKELSKTKLVYLILDEQYKKSQEKKSQDNISEIGLFTDEWFEKADRDFDKMRDDQMCGV